LQDAPPNIPYARAARRGTVVEDIRIPTDSAFIEDLVLQRTASFIACGGAGALNHWFATGDKAQLSEHLHRNGLLERFLHATVAEIRREADTLVAGLPPECFGSVVSIGPGNGILELLLMRSVPVSSLLLIDIESSDTHRHGFNDTGSGYASLAATRAFLEANGVAPAALVTCNPRREPLPDFEFDLLLSVLSMGFHYPCDDYVDFIEGNAHQRSLVVIDKRRDAPDAGYERLKRSFAVLRSTPAGKHDRVVLAMRGAAR
jgi:hypothetical protein